MPGYFDYSTKLNIGTGSVNNYPNLAEGSKELVQYIDNGMVNYINDNWCIYATGYTRTVNGTTGFTEISETANWKGVCVSANRLNLTVGTNYTVSVSAYADSDTLDSYVGVYFMMYDSSGTRDTSTKFNIYNPTSNSWTTGNSVIISSTTYKMPQTPVRYYMGFTWTQSLQDILDNGGSVCITIQANLQSTANVVHMFAPKISEGLNIFDEWSPALSETYKSGLIKELKPVQTNILNLHRHCVITSGTFTNTAKRGLNESQVWVGLAASNYFYPSNIVSWNITGDTLTVVRTGSIYGIGFPIKCRSYYRYTLQCTSITNSYVFASYYQSDGTLISYYGITATDGKYTFKTPANTDYFVILFVPNDVNITATIVEPLLYEGVANLTPSPTFATYKPRFYYAPDIRLPLMQSTVTQSEISSKVIFGTISSNSVVQAASNQGPDGVLGHCVYDDASTSYMTIPIGSISGGTQSWYSIFGEKVDNCCRPFTISVWLRPTNQIVSHWIFGRVYGDDSKTSLYMFMDINRKIRFTYGEMTSPQTSSQFISTMDLDFNKWNHITLIYYGGSSWGFFKNGVKEGWTGAYCPGIQNNLTDAMYLFGHPTYATGTTTPFRQWAGEMCDFRLYNTALTDTEVFNVYKSIGGNTANVIANTVTSGTLQIFNANTAQSGSTITIT